MGYLEPLGYLEFCFPYLGFLVANKSGLPGLEGTQNGCVDLSPSAVEGRSEKIPLQANRPSDLMSEPLFGFEGNPKGQFWQSGGCMSLFCLGLQYIKLGKLTCKFPFKTNPNDYPQDREPDSSGAGSKRPSFQCWRPGPKPIPTAIGAN